MAVGTKAGLRSDAVFVDDPQTTELNVLGVIIAVKKRLVKFHVCENRKSERTEQH